MGDNYCSTAESFDQVEEHKDRQAVDYIFTDQAPDSLEEEDPSPTAQKVPDQPTAAFSEDSQRKGETNILKRFFSMFSSATPKGGVK